MLNSAFNSVRNTNKRPRFESQQWINSLWEWLFQEKPHAPTFYFLSVIYSIIKKYLCNLRNLILFYYYYRDFNLKIDLNLTVNSISRCKINCLNMYMRERETHTHTHTKIHTHKHKHTHKHTHTHTLSEGLTDQTNKKHHR